MLSNGEHGQICLAESVWRVRISPARPWFTSGGSLSYAWYELGNMLPRIHEFGQEQNAQLLTNSLNPGQQRRGSSIYFLSCPSLTSSRLCRRFPPQFVCFACFLHSHGSHLFHVSHVPQSHLLYADASLATCLPNQHQHR